MLVVTENGGMYICEKQTRTNGWFRLENSYFIRKGKSIAKFAKVEIKSKYVSFIENIDFEIGDPAKTYNSIAAYILSKPELKSKLKRVPEKIKEVD